MKGHDVLVSGHSGLYGIPVAGFIYMTSTLQYAKRRHGKLQQRNIDPTYFILHYRGGIYFESQQPFYEIEI